MFLIKDCKKKKIKIVSMAPLIFYTIGICFDVVLNIFKKKMIIIIFKNTKLIVANFHCNTHDSPSAICTLVCRADR